MKTMKCPDCEKTFEAETSEDMMHAMMPHYKSDHAEIMAKGTEETKKVWMEEFNKNFEKAEEVK